MKVREVIRLLKQNGWQQVVQGGSHRQFCHPTKPGPLASILRQSGLSKETR